MKGSPRDPPLIHKTCHTKSFHTPASACCSGKVHLFISLKNVCGEKLSARENKFSGEGLPFVRYQFLWKHWQWGWCLARMCLRPGRNLLLQKSQSRGILPPGYLPMWLGWKTVMMKSPRLKGNGRRVPFLVYALEASSSSQARRQETNCNNWKKWCPHPNPVSSASGRKILFIRCHRHRTEDIESFQKPQKLHTTNILVDSKIPIKKKSKIKICLSTKYSIIQYNINSLNCSILYPSYIWKRLVDSFTSRNSYVWCFLRNHSH